MKDPSVAQLPSEVKTCDRGMEAGYTAGLRQFNPRLVRNEAVTGPSLERTGRYHRGLAHGADGDASRWMTIPLAIRSAVAAPRAAVIPT